MTGPLIGHRRTARPVAAIPQSTHRHARRVRIKCPSVIGSAKLLDGLTATVIGPHPIARGWVRIHLDPSAGAIPSEWSIAEVNLEELADGTGTYLTEKP